MPRKNKIILLVEDEPDIRALLGYNLRNEGYGVLEAQNGAEAITIAEGHNPDLIVLDIMMPVMDGLECCRRLRDHQTLSSVPILMLTARTGESSHVRSLDVGADSYLPKPVSLPVLFAQVKALLRSSAKQPEIPPVLKPADLIVDRNKYIVSRTVAGTEEKMRLPRKEFDLLFYLAANPGRVFSRQELLDEVWGPDVYVVDRTVDVHVRKIREKLGESYIETVKGVGYRFAEDLQ
ncbi:MAG: response regulator transcription factor [Rhodothermales bacterium]|nr:response regulator transcription factor [Rhodothermales bacterium]